MTKPQVTEGYANALDSVLRTFQDVKHGFEVNKSREYLSNNSSYLTQRLAGMM